MLKLIIIGYLLLAACSINEPNINNKGKAAYQNDTSIIKTEEIEGLWEVYNHPYESFFILIEKDSISLLKGPSQKYFFRHDTLNLEGGGTFKRKFIHVTEKQMRWVNLNGDTIILRRKI